MKNTRSIVGNNSDLIHFTLGIFAGLMVVNTASLMANSALTLLSGVTYGIIKSVARLV